MSSRLPSVLSFMGRSIGEKPSSDLAFKSLKESSDCSDLAAAPWPWVSASSASWSEVILGCLTHVGVTRS